MRIEELGEFGLIDRIRRTYAKTSAKAPFGIGDDAAALSFSSSATALATTDMLLEGVHFDLATTDLFSLGWKAAAVNLSDIAAMGGDPRFCLVGIGVPRRMDVHGITELYRGCRDILRKHRTLLVGGDTCRSGAGMVISVTVLGEAKRSRIIARNGARPGDRVFVTGTLGDSAAGLELLQGTGTTERRKKGTAVRMLIGRHLRPVPRVAWGRKLAASGFVTAMIDVSDGLSSDLGHICDESGVGAEVNEERIPLSDALRKQTGLRRPAVEYALSGGEDYELLFTVPAARAEAVRRLRLPVTEIGRITRSRSRRLFSSGGRVGPLVPSGYDHFSAQPRTRGRR